MNLSLCLCRQIFIHSFVSYVWYTYEYDDSSMFRLMTFFFFFVCIFLIFWCFWLCVDSIFFCSNLIYILIIVWWVHDWFGRHMNIEHAILLIFEYSIWIWLFSVQRKTFRHIFESANRNIHENWKKVSRRQCKWGLDMRV